MPTFEFKIRNVKGYGDVPNPIILELEQNKVNFIVAPNGAGKTSFVTAFECLQTGRIDVPKDQKYKKLERPASSLSIKVSGTEWSATGRTNKITPEWNPFVINTRISSEVIALSGARGALLNEAKTKVRRVKIIDTIPERIGIPYDFVKIQNGFGAKRNALKDYSAIINDVDFLHAVSESLPALYQFNYYDKARCRITDLVTVINGKSGNTRGLKNKMTDADFKTIEQYKNYKLFRNAFAPIIGSAAHKLDYFLLFYQLFEVYRTHTNEVKGAVIWAEYEFQKKKIQQDLMCVSCPWKGALISEEDGSLYIDFPLADEYSNGQRDIMTLYAQLMLFTSKLQKHKKYLLLLDEVFDYLDDANLLAAQYFVSKLLDESCSAVVYIMLFSHLDPSYYRTYVMKHLINIDYLVKVQAIPNTMTKCFIGYRDWLKQQGSKGDFVKMQLYQDLSNYMFHYTPNNCDFSAQIQANQNPNRLAKSTWGNKNVFYAYLINEVNSYLTNQKYDPYAVAFALRIRIEKIAYESIGDSGIRAQFLSRHNSFEKIDLCINNGITVPTFYMIVLAIGNESAHLRMINGDYEEKGMVYKLKNLTVKNIVSEVFKYTGTPLQQSCIL